MKNKAPLALMEQLVMLLVFALAAGLCLQVFVLSDRMSKRFEARDYAVLAVQNTAETMKVCEGDLDACVQLLGGSVADSRWETGYDAQWSSVPAQQAEYRVIAEVRETTSLLGSADIAAVTADGDVLFALTVSWQEAAYE